MPIEARVRLYSMWLWALLYDSGRMDELAEAEVFDWLEQLEDIVEFDIEECLSVRGNPYLGGQRR
ncbi:hypothetical protein OC835_000692 [Tilletia horrida]|nr:hypothetical protein OC835_000692 [Tilletia horrida]KAK0558465.1 hypothetical protein OC844_005128 [Tilletia horrida]